MLDIEKFRDAHESRRTPTEGVTLVAFYSHDKPKSLSDLTHRVADGLSQNLHEYSGLLRPYKDWLHATICGLEGAKDNQGEIVTESMKSRAKKKSEQVLSFAIEEFLAYLREYNWPITFRFGGCHCDDENPYDRDRKPWGRTYEVCSDGLAVLMGWPLGHDGQPFSGDIDRLRADLRKFGVVHKYHIPKDPKHEPVDNDLRA